ncbi:MAG TPA: hypothetical protein VK501_14975 [Baekduia sp.]|uniref:Dyp-type peroxidase n=1 Tax=Baekduia sp. TaxID=2600305 RepID=UPI002B65C0C3|nr:hypothetical protein [Baekduia sp.]HMJ35212.1 hypothetical protein [Baekduia sp.]
MNNADRLQPGIFFRAGERPPPCFRLQLFNVAPDTRPRDLHAALGRLFDCLDELREGRTADLGALPDPEAALFADVCATLAIGRRLFDERHHDPPLSDRPRPAFLAYLDQRSEAFPTTPWHDDPPHNTGEADLALQLIGPHDGAVNCTLIEIWKRIADDALPLRPVATFSGFGRPDGRGWLDFYDGVSNLEGSQRRTAIEVLGDPLWMAGGTYMAFLRFRIDLARWRALTQPQQEALVGRDKRTGRPAGIDGDDPSAFIDPPETTNRGLEMSHIHRANQSRASPSAPGALRIFRQGYDFLDTLGPGGPELGLNFISFQSDLATLQHLLHLPEWLGDVNFGGPPGSPSFVTLADGGFYAVPPRGRPFAGADLFRSPIERKA